MNFLYIYPNTILPWDSGVKKYLVYSRRGLNEADLGMKPYITPRSRATAGDPVCYIV